MIINYIETVASNHRRHLTVTLHADRATITTWTTIGGREIARGSSETGFEGAREIVRQHIGWGFRRVK